MITRINKNVICIKDIPSNLIEEAIFILKTSNGKEKSFSIKSRNKDIIMSEVNEIIKDCSSKLEVEREVAKAKEKSDREKLKRIKINVITSAIIISVICFIISLVK
ncbi:MAG: hypothetical protein J6B87_05855 [Clostridia bacterium]|nr:hypothetical protein [Clostridia bacterium]